MAMIIRRPPAIAVWLFAAVLGGCTKPLPEDVESAAVVPVTVASAEVGDITATVEATGVIAPAPGAELTVVAPGPSRIAEMPKAEGDAVKRGDVLVRFDIPSATADVAKQRADVGRAQARLANAKAAQARARDLFDRGVAARKEIEDADRDVADAEADLASARAGGSAAEDIAARNVVRAPFDGVVARRTKNPGDLVDASSTDPILRVFDPRRLEVVAAVPVDAATRVRVGALAHLVELSEAPALKVVASAGAVQPGTSTVSVRLSFAHPHAATVGAPARVSIDAESKSGVVVVPATALVRESGQTAVFVVEGNKAVRREVRVGIESAGLVEIASGVRAGEVVVTSGNNGLPDGAAVTTAAEVNGAAEHDAPEPADVKPPAAREPRK